MASPAVLAGVVASGVASPAGAESPADLAGEVAVVPASPAADYDDHRHYEEWCGWNDPADDNSSGYFDYSNPHGCEEWCGWNGPGTDGLCCDPYLSDVADGEPDLSWKLGLTVADVPDRSLPIMPNLDGKPKVPLYGFRESIPVLFSSRVRTLQCWMIPDPDIPGFPGSLK